MHNMINNRKKFLCVFCMIFVLGGILFCSCGRPVKVNEAAKLDEDYTILQMYSLNIAFHIQDGLSTNSADLAAWAKSLALSADDEDLRKNFDCVWVNCRLEDWTNVYKESIGRDHPVLFGKMRIDGLPTVLAADSGGRIFSTNEPVNLNTNFIKINFMPSNRDLLNPDR